MSGKRGDRAAPPRRPEGWLVRFATSEAAKGWEELCRDAPSNTWEAWVILSERPTNPERPERQHRLRGEFSTRVIRGRVFDQWQYEATSGGRVWYCPDQAQRVVWLTLAGTRHPKITD
ncbi:hypothetical protein UA75_04150 [Actinoalloteichus sp. GBA129-24]|uniref:Uncharacterized protein n=1 Tax=Actinoalloteichus fjordicus TaxID=1612552 RepID=A0AAC9PQ98_9PSEU|nr:hypothetical protein UA74_04050 [Actinoalloteichus fjordicus]APU18861.1 hypothetical protein UA75_04150 [Actinoalloteichus sp. GBA129-24]